MAESIEQEPAHPMVPDDLNEFHVSVGIRMLLFASSLNPAAKSLSSFDDINVTTGSVLMHLSPLSASTFRNNH
jgi:hypothetical protein